MQNVKPNTIAAVTLAAGSAIVDRAALHRAIDNACRVAEKRNTLPILSTVLIVGTASGITVTGTDLDIMATTAVPCAADPWLAVALPAHKTLDVLKRARDCDMVGLDVEQGGETATLDFAGLRVTLNALPAADFPTLKVGDMPHRFSMPTGDMVAALGTVAHAVSCEATRYYLNGVFLHPAVNRADCGGGKALAAVATDGHRLARKTVALPAGAESMPGIIVPSKTVGELFRWTKAKGAPSTVEVAAGAAWIEVTIGDLTVTSKLVDGTFPDYARVMPIYWGHEYVVNRSELIHAIAQVGALQSDKGRAVKLDAERDGRVRLTVNNPDIGTASLDMTATARRTAHARSTDPLWAHTWGMNSGYLAEAAGIFSGPDLVIGVTDPGSPVRLIDPTDHSIECVVMPMRV